MKARIGQEKGEPQIGPPLNNHCTSGYVVGANFQIATPVGGAIVGQIVGPTTAFAASTGLVVNLLSSGRGATFPETWI
jgi:hypothetical protein